MAPTGCCPLRSCGGLELGAHASQIIEIALASDSPSTPLRQSLLDAHTHAHPDGGEHEEHPAGHEDRLRVVEDEEHPAQAPDHREEVLQPAGRSGLQLILARGRRQRERSFPYGRWSQTWGTSEHVN